MQYTNWFKTNFENFAKEKEKFIPAFGISYRIRDPSSNPGGNFSITYDLSEDSEIARLLSKNTEDFVFANSLKSNLKEIAGKDNKYNFKLELVTVPLEESNTFWNFFYAYMRMTEDFYKKNRNISKPNSSINMAANSIIIWNLFNHKRPTELGFNYNKNGLAEADARILQGHSLEEYIKHNSKEYFKQNILKKS